VPVTEAHAARPSAAEAEALAAELAREARAGETRAQRRRGRRLSRLATDPASMAFALALADQVARIRDPRRAIARLQALVDEGGTPAFLGPVDRALLRAGLLAGKVAPRPVAALVRRRIRAETNGVVLPAEDGPLGRYLARRHADGIGLNVNLLGEAILGDDEAARRLERVLGQIARPDVDYVSVKVSAVCARLSSLALERSVERVSAALTVLFTAAAAQGPPVFVNLDMEEYRDLELTVEAFERALSAPGLRGLDAGIVLQAYLPDSHDAFERLATWAVARHEHGGGRVRVRIVKGANLLMERVEAELHGWVPAPYPTKADVDASYKRLLARALDPCWGDALHVGMASHNLYDVAWGLLLADRLGTRERLEVEMLEGMAPGQAEALRRRGTRVRLYAPVVAHDEFDAAVAYLARRLDEQSAPENYLRQLAEGHLDQAALEFAESLDRAVTTAPRRDQRRDAPPHPRRRGEPFANAADTDWAKAANRTWMGQAWRARRWPAVVPCRVGGCDTGGPAMAEATDPSAPDQVLYRYRLADIALVDRAVGTAGGATAPWDAADALGRAAACLEACRGELIAAMADDAGKTVTEGDIEVSEAVDYAAYYAREAVALERRRAAHRPLGTVVVAPPWNFPLAIPLGGVLAALAAGDAVILKPAPETVLTAWLGARCLWDAGVPEDRLQFLPCPDDAVGRHLITHAGVDAVVLTGSYDTAAMFLDWRPGLHLLAETSGKNAIVVTAAADLDLAVGDIVRSAFGHAGQKCSAGSLVIVERSVLDDGRLLRKLADATRTLVVGPAGDPATEVGPLIRPPSGVLERALSRLDPGEQWLVAPEQRGPQLWSPGVRTGVRAGSWFHLTECFGPVLGVMAADDLDHALELQNGTAFGLTGGLHSLDPGEVRHWLARVEVGNAYVNRHVTGAVVRRQPFGGWKRSAVGPTAKTGGPGYVPALCRWEGTDGPDYEAAWARLRQPRDASGLQSERNVLRHLPLPAARLLAGGDADPRHVELCRLAAATVGVELRDDASHVRVVGGVDDEVLRALHAGGATVDARPPVADGGVELLRWTREQAVSVTAHRYGRPLDQHGLGL
jgi:RHH-type proline utilization regulon transcriptional repressor/proline dehydrogenase/delta 1-pyrroline-5-carboxylate dehydrogenase